MDSDVDAWAELGVTVYLSRFMPDTSYQDLVAGVMESVGDKQHVALDFLTAVEPRTELVRSRLTNAFARKIAPLAKQAVRSHPMSPTLVNWVQEQVTEPNFLLVDMQIRSLPGSPDVTVQAKIAQLGFTEANVDRADVASQIRLIEAAAATEPRFTRRNEPVPAFAQRKGEPAIETFSHNLWNRKPKVEQ